MLVANLKRFQCWALAELLLEESRLVWTEDSELSEARAVLACDIAEGLRARGYRLLLLNDLRAEAWSVVANSCRIRGHFAESERAFEVAERYLSQGSGDEHDLVQLLDLKVSFLRDMGHYEQALRLLERVLDCHRAQRDQHLVGRALVSKAKLVHDWGRIDESIVILMEASPLLDPSREPQLELVVKLNLVVYLFEAGQSQQAHALLPEMKRLVRKIGNRVARLRALWIEGRVLGRLGRSELGEELLKCAHEGFFSLGIPYESALVTLDLAAIYLDAGRVADVRALAERARVFTALCSSETEREAIAVMVGFDRAVEEKRANSAVVERMAARLRSLNYRGLTSDSEL